LALIASCEIQPFDPLPISLGLNWQEAKTMKPLFVGKNAVKVASLMLLM